MSCEIPWSLEGLFVARAALPSYSLLPTGGLVPEQSSRHSQVKRKKSPSTKLNFISVYRELWSLEIAIFSSNGELLLWF